MRPSRKALRRWGRKHPYLCALIGLVVIAIVSTSAWLALSGREPGPVIFSGLSNVVVYWLITVVYLRATRKERKELAGKGQLRAFLRYPDSLPGSLSGIWNPGIVTPTEGALRFQPAAYETRESSGRSTNFTIADVSERWTITGKDRKYLPASAGYEAVTLATDKGRVELAASPESLDLLAVIRPPIGQDDPGPRGH